MTAPRCTTFRGALFLVAALLPGLSPPAAHANTYPMKTLSQEKPGTAEPLVIHYGKGLLDARIEGAPLGQVVRELGLATGARFTLIDPATDAQPVFARVASLPFTEGIKRILDGFSYAIYPLKGSHMPAVTVLSTPRPSSAAFRKPDRGSTTRAPLRLRYGMGEHLGLHHRDGRAGVAASAQPPASKQRSALLSPGEQSGSAALPSEARETRLLPRPGLR